MLFADSSGRIVSAKAFDLQNEKEIPVPESLQEHFYANALLIRHLDTESGITGILDLREGPILIASRPILTSEEEGPIHGTIIIGRFLDAAEIEHLAEKLRLSLIVRRLDDPQLPPDLQEARVALLEEDPILARPLNAETVAGYALLQDVYGKPSLVLRVDMPRDIYQQGQTSISFFMLLLLLVGLAYGMVTVLLIEKQILSRLTHISRSVHSIGASGDLSARVAMTGKDELSSLASSINRMLEALKDDEAKLEESNRTLARRARYLEATAEVARDATSILDTQELLRRAVTLISQQFGFYHTGIFLLDTSDEWAVLRAASSEGGQRMLAHGHRLRVGQQGIVGDVTSRGKPRIALDVGADAAFFDNPDLPDTRSEMALPLQARGEIIGALDVQSTEPGAFSDEDVAVLQTLADQVAMAISNARLIQQAQESLRAERRAYGELSREAWAQMVHSRPNPGYHYAKGHVTPLGDSHPSTAHPEVHRSTASQDEDGIYDSELPELALPITVRGQVIGTINAQKPSEAGEWTSEEIALMETLAEQLSLALESARLYQETQRRATHERLRGEVTARMRETLEVETVLKTAVQEMRQALGLPEVVVRLAPKPPAASETA